MFFSLIAPQNAKIDLVNEKVPKQGMHLPYLDGLRGLAALYVVFYHMTLVYYANTTSLVMKLSISWLQHGGWAVDIFIVLSGYCLMLPCVRTKILKGGLKNFLVRRARRILPPYYAIFFITLILSSISFSNLHWLGSEFSNQNIISHLFLIHNWFQDYSLTINPVLWSVATEWQIYFVFALVLFPVWRRFGVYAVMGCSIFLGYLPVLLVSQDSLFGFRPWFIVLFAMGMVAATVSVSTDSTEERIKKQMEWGLYSALLSFLTLLIYLFASTRYEFVDPFVGATTACALIFLSRESLAGRRPFLLKILSNKWAVGLGTFSYSLYLTHYAFLLKADGIVRHFNFPPATKLMVNLAVFLPLSLVAAYAFYLVFERPFMTRRSK